MPASPRSQGRRRRPAKSKRSGRRPTPRSRARRLAGLGFRVLLVCFVLFGGYVGWLDMKVRDEFSGKLWSLPARIYARSLDLYAGMPLAADRFERELRLSGYHPASRVARSGSYRRRGREFEVRLREFQFWDRREPARRVRLTFDNRRLSGIQDPRHTDRPVSLVRLDPALIGRIYPHHHEDRVLTRLNDVPPNLIDGLIAVEDRRFHRHHGISPRAIARAILANARSGAVVQGGSTLTQQLAKNFFLSSERSVWRKLNEAIIALLLEYHYPKEAILEAYLNEVFLGQEGRRAIHGFGLAGWFYFGRPLAELELHEQALLVALVRGASYYNPRRHPKRARARRDLVLDIMARQRIIDSVTAARAKRTSLGIVKAPSPTRSPHPHFIELVRRQLHRDYRDADLRNEGLRIFTTLDPTLQRAVDEAVETRTASLERRRGGQRRLEAAVVVTAAGSGEVLALNGGRDGGRGGFNRALDALRPIGSLVKPAIYLTAVENSRRFTLATTISDAPVRVPVAGSRDWRPRNYDGRNHGELPLFRALAQSNNLAAVRLGLALGIDTVADSLRRLGVRRPFEPYPSMLLGALSLTPLEVAHLYQTIASGGFRMSLRAISAVTDVAGNPVARYGLEVKRAIAPASVRLVIAAMRQVMASGTGRDASRRLSSDYPVAGKTGTTDDLRDSWFAGFSPERLVVTWMGHDDNSSTGLTGASGALKLWTDVMQRLGKPGSTWPMPRGLVWRWIDANSGMSTDQHCAGSVRLPFLDGTAPDFRSCGLSRDGAQMSQRRMNG